VALCTNCGTENKPGARFCGGCGTPLVQACPSCGAGIEAGMRFCSDCGAPAASRAVALASERSREPASPAAPAEKGTGRELRLV
jgi:predicted amidophosphoribosyltransferase